MNNLKTFLPAAAFITACLGGGTTGFAEQNNSITAQLNQSMIQSGEIDEPISSASQPTAGAAPASLPEYLHSQITTANQAFETAAISSESQLPKNVIEYKQFFLTIAPHVSFGIHDILDLEISPEVTLIWEKTHFKKAFEQNSVITMD